MISNKEIVDTSEMKIESIDEENWNDLHRACFFVTYDLLIWNQNGILFHILELHIMLLVHYQNI